ncbi:MAG: site-specific DNA-methyltransferase, partial [Trichococcus flocculiformis]
SYPKVHPTQKPIPLLKRLISIFTDVGDVVIDPVAGSGSTLRAAAELGRNAYGFEIKKDFFKLANEKMLSSIPMALPFDVPRTEAIEDNQIAIQEVE